MRNSDHIAATSSTDLQALDSSHPTDSSQPTGLWWLRGAVIVIIAALIGIASLALFCYAYGLNFQDEGWVTNPDGTPSIKQGPLVGSFVGMVVATILFWWGFMQVTRSKFHKH